MNIECQDRERIFLDGTAEEWAALEAHAASCVACKGEIAAWKNLSVAASELHEEWVSDTLWPRIEAQLRRHAPRSQSSGWGRFFHNWNLFALQWQTVAAAMLLLAFTGSALWFLTRQHGPAPIPENQALFNSTTIHEVDRAEAAYEQAIDRLDAQARAQLESNATPLMASYREKLEVLDSAIADLKVQAGINPGNGHLRRQLLAMYQEKQDTLEEVLEAKK